MPVLKRTVHGFSILLPFFNIWSRSQSMMHQPGLLSSTASLPLKNTGSQTYMALSSPAPIPLGMILSQLWMIGLHPLLPTTLTAAKTRIPWDGEHLTGISGIAGGPPFHKKFAGTIVVLVDVDGVTRAVTSTWRTLFTSR